MNYPFIFLNHGELCLDYVDKNTECFIWFEREVTDSEREMIAKVCPPPLSGLFVWGECFAYFGSGGDTFDFDIISCYTSDKVCKKLNKVLNEEEFGDEDEEAYERYMEDRSGNFPEIKLKSIDFSDFESAFSDLLAICVPRLSEDLEKWAIQIHQTVPVAFIKGPHGVEDEDEWNDWSQLHLNSALDNVVAYMETRNFAGSNATVSTPNELSDEDNEDPEGEVSNSYTMLPEQERNRYFGYIFHDILLSTCNSDEEKILNSEERTKRLKLAETIYNLDGIQGEVERLSIDEHNIHVNDDIILSSLKGLQPKERLAELNKLTPYTQLAYYASYGALKANDLLLHKDLAGTLKDLASKVPDFRKPAVTSLLSMIAHNLIQVTPAYTKPNKKHAGISSKIFDLISKQPNATENDFITGTVCCEWAGNPSLGLEISETGLKKFPNSKPLLHNAISVNNLTKNHKRAQELLAKYETLADVPDENFILNKSFNLIKSGKNKEANELLQKYVDSGGVQSANVLANLFYSYHFHMPDKQVYEKRIKTLIDRVKTDTSLHTKEFLENFLGSISNYKYYVETIELIDFLHAKGVVLYPSCWVNYVYSAYYLDEATRIKVAEAMEQQMPARESFFGENPLSLANLASIYASLNNLPKTIRYIKLCKKYHYSNYAEMKTNEDFKAFWNLKEFQDLFD